MEEAILLPDTADDILIMGTPTMVVVMEEGGETQSLINKRYAGLSFLWIFPDFGIFFYQFLFFSKFS